MPTNDVDLYEEDQVSSEELSPNSMEREEPAQGRELSHFAAMYVLQRDRSYLLRELYLQGVRREEMARETRRLRRVTWLRTMELARLRKARTRREKTEHVKNCRQRDSLLGNFHVYRKLTGQIEDVPDEETWVDPLESLCDFWGLTGCPNGDEG